ncbi:hypothetical protein ABVN80_15805 [Acinetobacter baumannii]
MRQTVFEGFTLEGLSKLTNWRNNIYHKQTVKLNLLVLVNFMSYKAPTGESNQYIILPRHRVLSIADTEQDQLHQLLCNLW